MSNALSNVYKLRASFGVTEPRFTASGTKGTRSTVISYNLDTP